MRLISNYPGVAFPVDTFDNLRHALLPIGQVLAERDGRWSGDAVEVQASELGVKRGNVAWVFDTWTEFLSEYRKPPLPVEAGFSLWTSYPLRSGHVDVVGAGINAHISVESTGTNVHISAPDRVSLLDAMSVFENDLSRAVPMAKESTVRVFLGHGRSDDWRLLKDHLHHKFNYEVEAYEVGERSGHTIRDVLESMLDSASFALLVMTAEDLTAEGEMRARQNVVHEAGLFQGRLGFDKAIAIVQEGVEVFSNLDGVQRIRYGDNIRETFGDVLAALHREFGPAQ